MAALRLIVHQTAWIDGPPAQLMVYTDVLNQLTRRSRHTQTIHQTVKTRSDNSPDGEDTLRQLTRRSKLVQTTHQTVKTHSDNSPDGQDTLRQLTRRPRHTQTTHQTVKTGRATADGGPQEGVPIALCLRQGWVTLDPLGALLLLYVREFRHGVGVVRDVLAEGCSGALSGRDDHALLAIATLRHPRRRLKHKSSQVKSSYLEGDRYSDRGPMGEIILR